VKYVFNEVEYHPSKHQRFSYELRVEHRYSLIYQKLCICTVLEYHEGSEGRRMAEFATGMIKQWDRHLSTRKMET
jgi:hypothetical protein